MRSCSLCGNVRGLSNVPSPRMEDVDAELMLNQLCECLKLAMKSKAAVLAQHAIELSEYTAVTMVGTVHRSQR